MNKPISLKMRIRGIANIVGIILALILTIHSAVGLILEHNQTLATVTSGRNDPHGIRILIGGDNITLKNFTMPASQTATEWYIRDKTINENVTVYGANFSSGATFLDISASNVELTALHDYYILLDSPVSWTLYRRGTGAVYPYTSQYVNITSSVHGNPKWTIVTNDVYGFNKIGYEIPSPPPPPPTNNTEVLFINQTPSDLSDTNLFTQNLNIIYRFNNTYSDLWLNYTIISGLNCLQDVNGTCIRLNNTYTKEFTNTSILTDGTFTNWSFILTENEVYPYRVNLIPSTAATYTNITLTNSNEYIADSILNLTREADFNIYEAPVRSTGTVRIYYYNSSYDFTANPTASPYVTEIYVNASLDGYNHNHFYAGHNIFPFSVNASGFVNSVYLNGGGFLIRGNTDGVIVTRDTRTTRPTATRYTSTNGGTWTNQAYTIASHVHTFSNGDYLTYQGMMNDSLNNIYNDTFRTDTYDITPFPPTTPNIITPKDDAVINQYVNVNYTASTPNTYGAVISNYTIDLYSNSLVKLKTIKNNGLNLNYTFDAYTLGLAKNYYYIFITATDDYGAQSVDFERFYLNYTTPNLAVSFYNFSYGNGLNVSPATTLNYSCTNSIGNNFTMQTTFNGANVYYGQATNATYYTNTSTLVFGYNNLTVNCSDHLGSVQETRSVLIYTLELCLIDEQDNTLFNPLNLTRTRVYFDDNSSYFDFKAANVSCINYTSAEQNKLRFDFGYIGGTTITRYIDTTLTRPPVRICANKEGVTYYEQLLISVSLTPVVMKSVYANCLIAADYTRFAYQDAYLLKAYSIETLYYLYKFTNGVQTFLASIDGSIETYVNIDNLEFRQNAVDINILTDAIAIKKIDNSTIQIYYENLRQDNAAAAINITRLDTSTIVYSNTDFSDPNEITILFDYSALSGVNQSTIFRVDGFFTSDDGTTHSIRKYFNTNGSAGFISSGIAFFISFLMMIFGLTFASTRITFSWFGVLMCLASIAIAAFAVSTWYLTMLIVVEVIVSLYIFIVMIQQGGKTISGVA